MSWLRPWAFWRLIMAKSQKHHGEEEHLPPDDEDEEKDEKEAPELPPEGILRRGTPDPPPNDAPTPPQDLPHPDQVPPKEEKGES